MLARLVRWISRAETFPFAVPSNFRHVPLFVCQIMRFHGAILTTMRLVLDAARDGKLGCLQALIAAGADVNATDDEDNSPLHKVRLYSCGQFCIGFFGGEKLGFACWVPFELFGCVLVPTLTFALRAFSSCISHRLLLLDINKSLQRCWIHQR